jgi:eukaryotic-like serine/threonine-protein kinase
LSYLVDSTIGRYSVHSFLRPGRVGDTYLASTDDGQIVWMKVMHDSFFDERQALARFEREARLLSKLQHRSVPRILDFGRTASGSAWLALEPVEGPTLKQVLTKGPLQIQDVIHLAHGLAEALEAAHDNKIIVRDVVPENILLVNSDPRIIKLLDLGFTRLVGTPVDADMRTRANTRIGDPTYMAPEYISDSGLDHRADLYSMGVVLYHALVGAPPFTGKMLDIMLAQVSSEPVPPHQKRPDTPSTLQHLVLSLLEKDPEHRPRKASEIPALLAT